MSVNITREVYLTDPFTLADMEQFIQMSKEIGVPTTKKLTFQITKGHSDMRESWPDSVRITARP